MTHEQQCGPSSLIVIYGREGAASDQVVRWCGICGAVVVDEDYDGRTSPGSVMPMRFPLRQPLPVEQLVGEATPDHPAIYKTAEGKLVGGKPKEPAAQSSHSSPINIDLCSDCPPVGYPTDKGRCDPCPNRRHPKTDTDGATSSRDVTAASERGEG